MNHILLPLVVVMLIAGCVAESDQSAIAVPKQRLPKPESAAGGSRSKLTGTVLETHDAGGYTYVKIDGGGEPRWAAVAQTDVRKGQNITVDAQMTVENFESKTLGRKFDTIIFGTVDGGASSMPGAVQHTSGPVDAGDVTVPKAEGAHAMTVAQVWSGKPDGRPVVVRGKVVKFLSGIMGKNWLHIRDGSGSADTGDHDLTVTTDDVASVGDVVVVRGVVRTDRDFGAGYRYAVIIEEAKLSQ